MRNIAILCLLLACALPALAGTYRADEIPNVQRMDRRRYVSDPDGILSPAAVAHIDSVCASLRERGLAQVAVVAVDDIAGGDTFSFAVDLFRSWGVGSAKSNNGLGILLVKDLREICFVTGGGLEGILPDALCKRIQLNYMLPAFREGDYSAGMVAGVGAAATILEGGEVDLGGDADAAHRDFLRRLLGDMALPKGSHAFWPLNRYPYGDGESEQTVDARMFLSGIAALKPESVILMCGQVPPELGLAELRPLSPSIVHGHRYVVTPHVDDLIGEPQRYAQLITFLKSIIAGR